jgi:hypothetical protein
MSRKAKRRRKSRRGRNPTVPQPSAPRPENEESRFQTPIGDFVRHESRPPYVEYYLFRPDHDDLLRRIIEKTRAGEELDWEEARHLKRFGLLMLASDYKGFNARLFLDRTLVDESELETLIEETYKLLGQIPSGSEGGVLSVHWMESIGDHSLG